MVFYHGSFKKFDIGFTLMPQNKYTSNENSKELEFFMESLRPTHLLSRANSVFLTDDPDLIDCCGGYIDYIYSVALENIDYEKSDLSWYSEAGAYLEDNLIEKATVCANNYWSGLLNRNLNSSCVEYRVRKATISSIYEIN